MTRGPSQLEQIRQIVERELDAGRPIPTRPQLALELGKPRRHDFGGRVTYELQKIKIERGIATAKDIESFNAKDGTYDVGSAAFQQRRIIDELKSRGEWFRA